MSSVNKVIILGRVGKEPEMKSFPNGDRIANFSVATSKKWRDKKTNEPKELTEWHKISVPNYLVPVTEKYVRKGDQVYLEGSLQTRSWEDKNGGGTRYITEIKALTIVLLGSKSGGSSTGQTKVAPSPPHGNSNFDDDIPF